MAEPAAQGSELPLPDTAEIHPPLGECLDAAYRRALSERIARLPASLHAPLLARLNEQPLPPRRPAPQAQTMTAASSPLAELLAYIGQQAHASLVAQPPGDATKQGEAPASPVLAPASPTPAPELKAVSIFRDDWSKLSTEQQLTQTLAQAPENAGPMNSQHLVLRSLQHMRDTAPDYLQGFMSYIDALIWLEQASTIKPASSEGSKQKKSAGSRRSGKSAKS